MNPGFGSSTSEPVYPRTRRGSDHDVFHGIEVGDPFRWLEDRDSDEVQRWLVEQSQLTTKFLTGDPDHVRIAARLTELGDGSVRSLPYRVGQRSFWLQQEPGDEQQVLYVTGVLPEDSDIELVNPHQLSKQGTSALTGWAVNGDATFVVYAIAEHGGDWQDIRIRSVLTGADLPEVIRWSKSEEDLPFPFVAWHPDGKGFYYNRFSDPGSVPVDDQYRYSQVYSHLLGTAQEADRLVFENPSDPDENFVPVVTDDGRYLVLHVWKGLSHRHRVEVLPLSGADEPVSLFRDEHARFIFLGNLADRLLFETNSGAPLGRIVGVDLTRPAMHDWLELIPEQEDRIAKAALISDLIVLVTIHDAHHRVQLFDLDGVLVDTIGLPGPGTVSDITSDPSTGSLVLAFESFLQPKLTLRYDIATRDLTTGEAAQVPFDFDGFVAVQHFFPAQDGTSIPITLVHRSGVDLDGTHAVLLYGYGGFDVSLTPTFDSSRLHWLESGGIFALVNARGGGEYGESWHRAGMLHHKQTVFDDFAAAAQWLIDSGYTTSGRLAICGESNGGLLVAATALQRPELFAAVACSIPVTDMLRYPRFTIGRYWVPEYGDAEADADQFRALFAYSPVHNVKESLAYPPMLVTTGENDDRVVPAHAMKFAAALQTAGSKSAQPHLLFAQPDVGHGLGKPRSKVLKLDGAIYTFLMGACDVKPQ